MAMISLVKVKYVSLVPVMMYIKVSRFTNCFKLFFFYSLLRLGFLSFQPAFTAANYLFRGADHHPAA